jgi:hypothetical protein
MAEREIVIGGQEDSETCIDTLPPLTRTMISPGSPPTNNKTPSGSVSSLTGSGVVTA